MCSWIVVVCVLGLFTALPSHADNGCADWDGLIEDLVFGTARDEIIKAGKAYVPVPDVEQSVGWHTGISMINGTLGNLTSFELVHFRGSNPASLMCQTSNETNSNTTIAMDVGLSNLAITFESFLLRIPILPNMGNTKTRILNSGNAVSVSVSVLTTPTSNCTVILNYFQIHDVGTFSVQFEHGFWNWIYQRWFNVSSRLIKWGLDKFGVMSKLEGKISTTIYDLASQQGPQVCELIHNVVG